MNQNLPIQTILDTAKRINKLEERLSEIYKSVNLALEQAIKNSEEINNLKNDVMDQLALMYNHINDTDT